MRGRRLTVALAAVALAAGAALILLGRAVLGERSALVRADASLAAPLPPAPVSRGGGVAGMVLRTGDDRAARAAAADFQQARAQTALAPAVRAHEAAVRELAPFAQSGPSVRRAWASTLVAVLEVDVARLDRRRAKRHVQAAVEALQAAVAADAGNEDAKRDLELLLTMQSRGGSRQGKGQDGTQRQQSRQSNGHDRKPGRAGASMAPPGSGW